MTRPGRYPQELRERAVRLVFEHQDKHPPQWAAICSIADKFGMSSETLRKWVRLLVPPVPRWLVDDATPEALAGLLATYGRIALLSPEGDVFDQMAGRYNQTAGPNLGVYLKGHAGDLLKVDRRGRPPEYVERPCLTIGLTVQPEVLRGLASRPGFGGRGLLARFLYSLPQSLVGRRQPGASPVPPAVADRYTLELQALAASVATVADADPTLLTLDPQAGELLLAFERDLEPRLAADSGDLAHLAGWAAKLAGASCNADNLG
jgi:replicative DNA helicase